jgi:CubicO group peptidase (beta-lactamase class C family)
MHKNILFLLLPFVCALTVKAQPAGDTGQPTAALLADSLFNEYHQSHVTGISAMVIHDGHIIYDHSSGLADVEHKVPVTSHTNYRIASVTKQFTAMAVMMLKEEGKLSLNDPLTRFFPEIPAYGRQITMRHMLNHTSGLLDYGDLVPPGTTTPLTGKDVLRLIAQQDSTFFPPGQRFQYSNTAYVLLGLIVEKVSGMPYGDFLRQRIFTPLGMNHTLLNSTTDSIPNRAYGYTLKEGQLVKKDQSIYSYLQGDGGIYSSASDFCKWDQALYTSRLVQPETLKEIFTASAHPDDRTGYGYGWYVEEKYGFKRISHSGGTSGFSSYVVRYPEQKFSILLFANQNEGVDLGKMADALENIYLARYPTAFAR